jgi:tetratricopeptide (TPR) repeat protein
MRLQSLILFVVVSSVILLATFCGTEKDPNTNTIETQSPWRNHADSVSYVGMNVCKQCHSGIHETFIHTGMGQSFDTANSSKSAGKFGKESTIYDKEKDFWYHSGFRGNTMFITEFRLDGRDTIFKREEKVDYIVGSGQHTNSHMYSVNGYFFQMPMTFYAQKGQWDLPPGFENGYNSRFDRIIGLECMSCHNSLPSFVKGSENKFDAVPDGITCERCHGPGSLHVREKQAGIIVDTSTTIDYSIVNPGKLSPELQFDVCQRCHLQGNAVLKPGKSFLDFRPGMKLSDVMTVFMPKYEGAEDQFIMASHAERLKMSACFLQTEKQRATLPENSLHPYKSALTCVTCHNPHITVKQTGSNTFNATCTSCHGGSAKSKLKNCSDTPEHLAAANNNCVSCHMPRSGSIDIPHVTVHDHYIRRPVAKTTAEKPQGRFLGLYAINEKEPSPQIKARAYLQQFEKFDQKLFFLDSAARYLPDANAQQIRNNLDDLVQLRFLQRNFEAVKNYVRVLSSKLILDSLLVQTSFDNRHAWTAYRIGEAFYSTGDAASAEPFYKKASDLAPFHPDFRNKYALSLASRKANREAREQYQQVINLYPKHVSSLTSLGYLWLLEGDDVKAESYYNQALALDPDDEQALLNLAGLYLYRQNYVLAEKTLDRLLKHNPKHVQATQIKAQLKTLKK